MKTTIITENPVKPNKNQVQQKTKVKNPFKNIVMQIS